MLSSPDMYRMYFTVTKLFVANVDKCVWFKVFKWQRWLDFPHQPMLWRKTALTGERCRRLCIGLQLTLCSLSFGSRKLNRVKFYFIGRLSRTVRTDARRWLLEGRCPTTNCSATCRCLVAAVKCMHRWQTRATRCITANVLQTNKVDAQCDKLATELRWQLFAWKSQILSHRTCI